MTDSSRSGNIALPREQWLVCIALLGDILLIIASDLASFAFRFERAITQAPPMNFTAYLHISAIILMLRLACFYVYGLYNNLKAKTTFEITLSVVKASTMSTLGIVAAAFYVRALEYPRTVIIISWVHTIILIIMWRIFIRMMIAMLFGKDAVTSRVAIVGTGKAAQQFGLHLSKNGAVQYDLVGFVDTSDSPAGGDFPYPHLGALEVLPKIVMKWAIDEVIIATTEIPRIKLFWILSELTNCRVKCKVIPQVYDAVLGNIVTSPIDDRMSVLVSPIEERFYWYRGFKRVFDLLIATAVLVVTTPILPLIALAIKATSAGPVFLLQKRVGLNGKPFVLFKFRTMHKYAERGGPVWAKENDPRVTGVGRFLRKTRLDEIPQIINVFRNEMSFVGPRPERLYFVARLKDEIPFYLERLTIKPGITGWAQITVPYADSVEDSKIKFIHDMYYVKNMCFALDLLIIMKTVVIVFQEKGAQ